MNELALHLYHALRSRGLRPASAWRHSMRFDRQIEAFKNLRRAHDALEIVNARLS